MLKIRLMGTKKDIAWFGKVLRKSPEVKVTEFSDTFQNKGTDKYYRAYVEVENNSKENLGK